MNTARTALAKGKRVLAVPNSLLEPKSCGTNHLLAEGAQVYLNDQLLVCDPTFKTSAFESSVHRGEEAIVEALHNRAHTTSEIDNLLDDDTKLSVMEFLADMELADKIVFRSDGKWHLLGGI